MGCIEVGYFFEDIAQAEFLRSILERVAREERGAAIELSPEIFCTERGSRVVTVFREYMRDFRRDGGRSLSHDLLVVARDCDRRGRAESVRPFHEAASGAGFPEDRICFATPDPNIQRWYLADTGAFARATRSEAIQPLPYVSCRENRTYYKDRINSALDLSGLPLALEGAEYGRDIARLIDMDHVGRNVNNNFNEFVSCIKRVFRAAGQ
jgi:hypothetical protein